MMSCLQPSAPILPWKNWRHLEGNRSGIHSPNWAGLFCLLRSLWFKDALECTETEICRISSVAALSGRSFTFSPLLRLVYTETNSLEKHLFWHLSDFCSRLQCWRFKTTQLSLRRSPSLKTSLSSKLRRAAWRCVTSPPPSANPAMAVISPRQHPPPLPSSPLLHLSLCAWMMSSFQLPLSLTDWLINTLTHRRINDRLIDNCWTAERWLIEWLTQRITCSSFLISVYFTSQH